MTFEVSRREVRKEGVQVLRASSGKGTNKLQLVFVCQCDVDPVSSPAPLYVRELGEMGIAGVCGQTCASDDGEGVP